MVDNQHKKITGFRDLTEDEIELINVIKGHEAGLASLLHQVMGSIAKGEGMRQAAIARTEFEGAFMRLVRAVAQPESPWVREEA